MALLSGSEAIKISTSKKLRHDAVLAEEQKLAGKSDEAIAGIIQNTLSEVKSGAFDPKKTDTSGDAVGKATTMAAVQNVVADRILGSPHYGWYPGFQAAPIAYPLYVAPVVAAPYTTTTYNYGAPYVPVYHPYTPLFTTYHSIVNDYTTANAIAGLVNPAVADAVKALEGGDDKKKEEAPKAAAFVQ